MDKDYFRMPRLRGHCFRTKNKQIMSKLDWLPTRLFFTHKSALFLKCRMCNFYTMKSGLWLCATFHTVTFGYLYAPVDCTQLEELQEVKGQSRTLHLAPFGAATCPLSRVDCVCTSDTIRHWASLRKTTFHSTFARMRLTHTVALCAHVRVCVSDFHPIAPYPAAKRGVGRPRGCSPRSPPASPPSHS